MIAIDYLFSVLWGTLYLGVLTIVGVGLYFLYTFFWLPWSTRKHYA